MKKNVDSSATLPVSSHTWIDVAGHRRIECKTCGTRLMVSLQYVLSCDRKALLREKCLCGKSIIGCFPECALKGE